MDNSLTGQLVMDTYLRLVQVVDGVYYDGSGNQLSFASSSFSFVQNQPVTVWSVQHNLGRYPNVSVIDTADNVMYADVRHVTLNLLTVTFGQPTSGIATCS